MNQGISFVKMEGIGNDYVYINDMEERIDDLPTLAIELSERHFGIGSDGLIVLRPSAIADFKMRMFNLDGSEGKMCGNGIRCLAKFAYDSGLTQATQLSIETLSGIKSIELLLDANEVVGARVNMGKPILMNTEIPVRSDEAQWLNYPLEVKGQSYAVTTVSMGNPHAVIFQDTPIEQLNLTSIGPAFEWHEAFPEQVNTEFVNIISDHEVTMRVWERGSGETLACGTGACAVVVAGIRTGRLTSPVKVNLLGGQLHIHWDQDETGDVIMEGPARTAFAGTYYPKKG